MQNSVGNLTILLDATLLRFKFNNFAMQKCSDSLQNTDVAKKSYHQTTDYENLAAFIRKNNVNHTLSKFNFCSHCDKQPYIVCKNLLYC